MLAADAGQRLIGKFLPHMVLTADGPQLVHTLALRLFAEQQAAGLPGHLLHQVQGGKHPRGIAIAEILTVRFQRRHGHSSFGGWESSSPGLRPRA